MLEAGSLPSATSQAGRHTWEHHRAGVTPGQAHGHPQAKLRPQPAASPLLLIPLRGLPQQPEAELRAAMDRDITLRGSLAPQEVNGHWVFN